MNNAEMILELLSIKRVLTDGRLDDSDARDQAEKLVTGVLISLDSKFIA